MTSLVLVAAALLSGAEPAAVAPAPQAPVHEQHGSSESHRPVAASDARCCCEEMMHKMMTEMMQKHRGTDPRHSTTAETPKQEGHKH